MNKKKILKTLTEAIISPKIITFSNLNKHNAKIIKHICLKYFSAYSVGTPQKKLFHKKTIYEELYDYLQDKNKVLQYAEKRNLSQSRLNRPLSFLSSEKWRASIAIGMLSKKNVFVIPWIDFRILNMYCSLWMNELFKECRDLGISLIVLTNIENCIDFKYDLKLNFE